MTKEQIAQIRAEVAAVLTARLAAIPSETAILQRAARALRQSESIEQWMQIVADAGAHFAIRVALLPIDGELVAVKAMRGPGTLGAPAISLQDAPALQQVIESKELVVCLTSQSQLGGLAFSPGVAPRAHLLPIVGKTRVLGVLYAEGEVNLPALETLTALAAGSLELRKAAATAPTLIQPIAVDPEHKHPASENDKPAGTSS